MSLGQGNIVATPRVRVIRTKHPAICTQTRNGRICKQRKPYRRAYACKECWASIPPGFS